MDFGGGTVGIPGPSSTEAFPVKYSAGGEHLGSKAFDGPYIHSSQAVGTDGQGNAYWAGYVQSSINLGGGHLQSAGNYDIFLGKLAP